MNTVTKSEVTAYHVMTNNQGLHTTAGHIEEIVHWADELILLAERIKSERTRAIIDKLDYQ